MEGVQFDTILVSNNGSQLNPHISSSFFKAGAFSPIVSGYYWITVSAEIFSGRLHWLALQQRHNNGSVTTTAINATNTWGVSFSIFLYVEVNVKLFVTAYIFTTLETDPERQVIFTFFGFRMDSITQRLRSAHFVESDEASEQTTTVTNLFMNGFNQTTFTEISQNAFTAGFERGVSEWKVAARSSTVAIIHISSMFTDISKTVQVIASVKSFDADKTLILGIPFTFSTKQFVSRVFIIRVSAGGSIEVKHKLNGDYNIPCTITMLTYNPLYANNNTVNYQTQTIWSIGIAREFKGSKGNRHSTDATKAIYSSMIFIDTARLCNTANNTVTISHSGIY
jgi:hypothetical protein